MQTNPTVAEKFSDLSERERNDLKHDSWDATVSDFMADHPDWYEMLDSTSKVSWDDMRLEVKRDQNGHRYFGIVTGFCYSPGNPGDQRLFETAIEFMDRYRDELEARIEGR